MIPDEEDEDQPVVAEDNVVTSIVRRSDRARNLAVAGIEESPDDAVRAIELGQASGVPANAILGDLKEFDLSQKRKMAAEIIRGNHHLTQYVNADPIHSRISNDDYGQLDTVSQSVHVIGESPILRKAIEGFKEGFGDDHVGGWMIRNPKDLEWVAQNRLAAATMSVVGMPVEMFFRTIGGAVGAVAEGAGEFARQAGGHPLEQGGEEAWAKSLTRDVHAAANALMPELMKGIGGPSWKQANKEFKAVIDAAKPYVEAGVEPPVGVHKAIDEVKMEQSKLDLDNLNDALKEAQASKTRERNPEIFASFIRQHTDAKIGISADAVQKLYGDKLPEPTDNVLGWAPRIREQIETAIATGADIEIPLADWLAKVDPETAKLLNDDIRVRPGGITKIEAEGLKEFRKTDERLPPATPIEGLRDHAAVADSIIHRDIKQLKLEAAPELREKVGTGEILGMGDPKSQFFKMVDEVGKDSGFLELVDKGKELYVEFVSSGHDVGRFSPRLVRDLLRQLKEQFPEAESIGGYRVSGTRQKFDTMGKTKVALAAIDQAEVEKLTGYLNKLRETDWEDVGGGAKVIVKPSGKYTEHEQAIDKAVHEVLERIAPTASKFTVDRLKHEEFGGEIMGLHRSGTHEATGEPISQILVSMAFGERAKGVARHEAIHHLYRKGFFKADEWKALQDAAVDGKWIEQYQIEKNYGKENIAVQVEEAIAHAYDGWATSELKNPGPKVQQAFQKLKEFLDQLLRKIEEIIGYKPTFEELFERVESGEVGKRAPGESIEGLAASKQLELDVTRMEDKAAFEKAAAIGMTVDQYKRYMKLIEKRQAEDLAAIQSRAEKDQARRLTSEWKEHEKAEREIAVESINNRPDVAADNFFREGTLYGNKVEPVRLSSEHLSPEQIEALPKSYVRVNGIHPDDAASLFGYPSGRALVEGLIGLDQIRKDSGVRPEEFKRHLIKLETERQMQAKYGDLERNILEEAKDQVISETQLDLLHEETMALAQKAGMQFSITKDALKSAVKEQFDKTLMGEMSTDKFLAAAGKAGRAAEDFLLKEKPGEAFKEKQRQYLAMQMANQAKAIEKAQASLEKTAKRFAKREVPGIERDYQNYIQDLLQQAGYALRVSPDEVATSIEHGGYKSLGDFVADKSTLGWDPQVSEGIQLTGAKPIEKMTTAEFADFKDAIDSLNYIGRQERKIEVAGQAQEMAEFRKEVMDNITQLPVRSRDSQGRWFYKIDASLTRMEEMVKDLDLRQELGPIFNAVIVPMMQSKAKSFDLLTDLSRHFKETKGEFGKEWRKSLSDTIPQDFLIDPYYRNYYDMTRENLLQVMLNWGNRSNIEKLTRGYASLEKGALATKEEARVFEAKLKALIDEHARPEDWQFVSRMWEPFKTWQPMTDTVSRNTSGIVPKWIQPESITTPHGQIEGGYWPVKYDRLGSDLNVIEDRKLSVEGVFGKDYFRAATAKSHLQARTGYVDYVDINTSIEQAAGVMQQTIHDIAYRDALMQASKVFYDKPIRAAIRKHYGEEYEAQLIPWLKRIANQNSVDEKAIQGYNDWMRRARVNLVGHALPLNLKVIFSPDVGVPNGYAWTAYLANRGEYTKLALEKSNEIRHLIYNMDRDFREQLERTVKAGALDGMQAKAVEWGFLPVAKVSQEFRVSTFVDQYNKAKGRGLSDVEAATIADSYVRERHGAASVVDLPAIMQSNEALKALTMFYGYFNTMYNWQRQLPGNVRRGEAKNFMVNGLGSVVVGAGFGALLFNNAKQDDSWWKIMAKALTMQPLSTVPGLREASSLFFEGFPQRTPTESVMNAINTMYTDVKRKAEGKPMKAPIKNAANVVGLTTGLPMAQIGRTGQFLADVQNRKQHPRNILEWIRGIVHGEAKLKK